jgi:hypothetical protein
MKKITSNPPETPSLSAYASLDKPKLGKRPGTLFVIAPDVDTETLLVQACETLASLNIMSTDLAFELEGSSRNVALAIQQIVVLGELLVNRALDNLEPSDTVASGVKPTFHH